MFSQFFGTYLLDQGKITEEQFSSCMEYMKSNRVKLGLIAESEGLLTRAQADELNRLQMQTDKRFGDLAVEKGYLTDNDISRLLKLQGNAYLIFIQALIENNILSQGELDALLNSFQKDNGFTNSDLVAMKSVDFERLLPTFIQKDNEELVKFAALAMRNVVRFVSTYVRIGKASFTKEYSAKYISYQQTAGDYDGFIGFASDDNAILSIADGYAGESFDEVDEDALDAVCEFANCINGLYATELSYRDINIDMLPPAFFFDNKVSDDNEFLVLPIYITGKKIDLLLKR